MCSSGRQRADRRLSINNNTVSQGKGMLGQNTRQVAVSAKQRRREEESRTKGRHNTTVPLPRLCILSSSVTSLGGRQQRRVPSSLGRDRSSGSRPLVFELRRITEREPDSRAKSCGVRGCGRGTPTDVGVPSIPAGHSRKVPGERLGLRERDVAAGRGAPPQRRDGPASSVLRGIVPETGVDEDCEHLARLIGCLGVPIAVLHISCWTTVQI